MYISTLSFYFRTKEVEKQKSTNTGETSKENERPFG